MRALCGEQAVNAFGKTTSSAALFVEISVGAAVLFGGLGERWVG
jgi:hypothetical protein